MKTILLLRHAKSSPGTPGQPDHERPLNGRGKKAAELVAEHLLAEAPRPDLILCSTATRTRQTLAPLLDRLKPAAPPVALEKGLYLASEDVLLKRLRALPTTVATVLMIGHNDGMWQAAEALAGHGEESLLESLREKFPTGALATLQIEIDDWSKLQAGAATLAAYACPKDLD